jgi:hypothetical protein
MENEPKGIFPAMAAIMAEVGAIGKDQVNQAQGFRFRGIDQVYNALNPLMAKHGVFLVTEIISHEHFEKPTKSGGLALHHFARCRFRFCHKDGSSITAEIIGEASDTGDKGLNKAYSIALKYALFQAFLIPTEDDPDKHTVEYSAGTAAKAGNGNGAKMFKAPDPALMWESFLLRLKEQDLIGPAVRYFAMHKDQSGVDSDLNEMRQEFRGRVLSHEQKALEEITRFAHAESFATEKGDN